MTTTLFHEIDIENILKYRKMLKPHLTESYLHVLLQRNFAVKEYLTLDHCCFHEYIINEEFLVSDLYLTGQLDILSCIQFQTRTIYAGRLLSLLRRKGVPFLADDGALERDVMSNLNVVKVKTLFDYYSVYDVACKV